MNINKIENYVFDNSVHKSLFKLSSNKIIDSIDTPISSGKEAVTFLGHTGENNFVAKIYKMETSNFKHLNKYIIGDPRFKNIKKDIRDIFLIWASKEYRNLNLLLHNQVSAPLPIAKEKNILIMSFIGENGIAHPKLANCKFDLDIVYPQIIDNYAKMLYKANLVHADFSAYNILIDPTTQKIYIIDVGQAVLINHPKSKEFLKRDIINMVDFINKKYPKINLTYEKFLEDLKSKKVEFYGRDSEDK
jgi:RIO kinase 1